MAGDAAVSGGLFAESCSGIDLQSSLRAVDSAHGLEGAVSMLYTPARFAFGRVAAGAVHDAAGSRIPLQGVFEARIFTPDVELRWVADETGGRAALLHEQGSRALGSPWDVRPVGDARGDTLPVAYLLWGEAIADRDELDQGWCRLGEARVGALTVPHQAVAGRLRIAAIEYLGVDGEYGNTYVVAERLLRIEPVPAEATQTDG